MDFVKLSNITKEYKGKCVLGPIDLTIEKGTAIAVFGANGAGKTTLCEIISNTKNKSAGEIVYGFDTKNLADVIGINFQDQSYPNFILVKELLHFYKKVYDKKVASEQFDSMVKKFNLNEIMNRKVNSLSGGQRQRVNLFLSLFHSPQLFIGDEISTGLDIQTRSEVIEFLKEQIEKFNTTIILVSHNLDEIEALCSRIIFLQEGKIIDDTTVSEVVTKYGSLLKYYLEKVPNQPTLGGN